MKLKQPYPELADPKEWTPRMKYIHRRAWAISNILGFLLGACVTSIVWLVVGVL